MKRMKLGIRSKLLLISLGGVLAFALGATASFSRMRGALELSQSTFDRQVAAERELALLSLSFRWQVQEWKDYLLRGATPELHARHWSAFERRERETAERAEALRLQLESVDPAGAALVARFQHEHEALGIRYRAAARAFAAANWSPLAGDVPIRGADRGVADALNELTSRLERAAAGNLARASAQSRSAQRLALALLALAGLFALAASALLSTLWVHRPLASLLAVSERVSQGDLASTVELRTGDELETLSRSFSRLITNLREIPLRLSGSLEGLSGALRLLDGVSRSQQEFVSRQAVSLQETQVTAQEIQQTSRLAVDKAQVVLEGATRGEQLGRDGREAVERTVQGLATLRQHVDSVAERVGALRDQARRVDAINRSVKDIADQCNMLALNAAIEAVRSGEHGKGFSVVAREIRSLADQSIRATGMVREILQEIDLGVQQTVSLSEEGRARVVKGIDEVQTSGRLLETLSTSVQDTSASVRQIAAALSQQGAGVSQIFTAVTEQNQLMEETVRTTDSLASAIGQMQSASAEVERLVRSYRL